VQCSHDILYSDIKYSVVHSGVKQRETTPRCIFEDADVDAPRLVVVTTMAFVAIHGMSTRSRGGGVYFKAVSDVCGATTTICLRSTRL